MLQRKAAAAVDNKIASSLPFAVLLHLNRYFATTYFLLNIALFIYKDYKYPYPDNGSYGWEVTFIFFFLCIEYIRLFLGSKGNKTEQIEPLFWFIGLSIGTILLNIYYLKLQTYVLQIDAIINIMSLVLVSGELLFCTLAALTFARNGKL